MKKRIFDLTSHDVNNMTRAEIVECIKQSEGRTMMVENVVSIAPPLDLVSGAEIAAAFGADMITLNCLDIFNPRAEVTGAGNHGVKDHFTIEEIRDLTGRLIGCNLEPVPFGFTDIEVGRSVTRETVEYAVELGMHYIMLTGNPGMNVSQETILDAIRLCREVSQNIVIIAGKMHGGGVGNDYNLDIVSDFAEAGADIMMFPAPYTTSSVSPDIAHQMMDAVHNAGMLGLLAIGTSQEGASESYIEQVAMASKGAGADILHIGDGGYGGIAPPENIIRMGMTIRGRRHQFKRMANRR
ncbi:dihydrodipicolinate synthase [Photobacterium lipolyticum]|uniref:Dihydrodipicolinate synthase n=1 Tax=Photobacterium lipolyticum TaxID=266810 RepID=A0A2T3N3F8_9GAMM|nr:dihydrodipicolinate synthase [Photobacterium lipolyticum]PSW06909.1 dihydrodipicolinate synthase [Photobacterium lipolyticum]